VCCAQYSCFLLFIIIITIIIIKPKPKISKPNHRHHFMIRQTVPPPPGLLSLFHLTSKPSASLMGAKAKNHKDGTACRTLGAPPSVGRTRFALLQRGQRRHGGGQVNAKMRWRQQAGAFRVQVPGGHQFRAPNHRVWK
jgi:hypothetical protein